MFARRALPRRLGTLMDITTVGTVPFNDGSLLEDLASAHISAQFPVALLMEFLHLGDFLE